MSLKLVNLDYSHISLGPMNWFIPYPVDKQMISHNTEEIQSKYRQISWHAIGHDYLWQHLFQ